MPIQGVVVGQILTSNSGPFMVISVGAGEARLHPPTDAMLPLGTILENPDGTCITSFDEEYQDDDGNTKHRTVWG